MRFFAHKCLSAQGGGVDFFQWKFVSCWTYVGTSNKLLAYIPCSRATVACSPFNLHTYKVRLFLYFFVIMMDAKDAHSTCSTNVCRHVRRHLWVLPNKARRGVKEGPTMDTLAEPTVPRELYVNGIQGHTSCVTRPGQQGPGGHHEATAGPGSRAAPAHRPGVGRERTLGEVSSFGLGPWASLPDQCEKLLIMRGKPCSELGPRRRIHTG